MGMAILDLHWTAEQFWQSTPHELYSATEMAAERTKEGRKKARERKFASWRDGIEKKLKDRDG